MIYFFLIEQIFNEIKLDQLDEKIISDPEYNSLTNPTKNAIQLLLDLNKGKMEIYNKCYNIIYNPSQINHHFRRV